MKNLVITMRKKGGYVSIETVIVAGLIIGLGALAISSFQKSANGITGKAIKQVNDVQANYDGLKEPSAN